MCASFVCVFAHCVSINCGIPKFEKLIRNIVEIIDLIAFAVNEQSVYQTPCNAKNRHLMKVFPVLNIICRRRDNRFASKTLAWISIWFGQYLLNRKPLIDARFSIGNRPNSVLHVIQTLSFICAFENGFGCTCF